MTNKTILGAIVWAVAFILSAFVFKGNALGDWIEGALLVVWIVFIAAARRPGKGHSGAGEGTGAHR